MHRLRIRLAIEDTLKTGRDHREIEYCATLQHKQIRRDVVMLGATSLIQTANQSALLLCLNDITERKQAENSLRNERSSLPQAIRGSHRGHHSGRCHDRGNSGLQPGHVAIERL